MKAEISPPLLIMSFTLALSAVSLVHAAPPPDAPPAVTLAGRLAGRLPEAGHWLAARTGHGTSFGPDVFSIVHLDAAGLDVVFSSASIVPIRVGWLDAETLVAVTWSGATNAVSAHWFVKGAPVHEAPVPAAAWALDEPLPELPPELHITGKGEAFISHCLASKERGGKQVCTREVFVKLARDAAPTRVPKQPAGIVRTRSDGYDDGLPVRSKIEAPAAVRASITTTEIDGRRIKGVRCESPEGTSIWPTADTVNWEFAIRPTKITWLATTPPLFVVSGRGVSPIEEPYTGRLVFRACEREPIEAVRWLGDGLWVRGTQVLTPERVVATAAWTVYVDDLVLGSFPGDNMELFVAPYRAR